MDLLNRTYCWYYGTFANEQILFDNVKNNKNTFKKRGFLPIRYTGFEKR